MGKPKVSFSVLRKNENGNLEMFWNEYLNTRSQDLEKAYPDAGQFYWLHTQTCIDKGKIITENSGSIIISEMEGQDIDNEIDWKLAEIKYKLSIN